MGDSWGAAWFLLKDPSTSWGGAQGKRIKSSRMPTYVWEPASPEWSVGALWRHRRRSVAAFRMAFTPRGMTSLTPFTHGEAAHRLERQGHPSVPWDLGVATEKNQAELVVGDLAFEEGLGREGLRRR